MYDDLKAMDVPHLEALLHAVPSLLFFFWSMYGRCFAPFFLL
jgi:hypothetical protein